MSHVNYLEKINKGEYFEINIPMTEVIENKQWLFGLSNEGEREIMVSNIEFFWDGGDATPINKREAIIEIAQGQIEVENCDKFLPQWPNAIDKNELGLVYCERNENGDRFRVVTEIDPEETFTFPVKFGQTKLTNFITLLPEHEIIIGAHSRISGNISVIIKGFINDQREKDSSATT